MNLLTQLSILFGFLLLSIPVGFSQPVNSNNSAPTGPSVTDSLSIPTEGSKKIKKRSFFDFLHQQGEVSKATLTTDLNKLNDPKNKLAYWGGTFALHSPAGVEKELKVKVRLRGRFRLIKCDFPPLKLKFKKKGFKKNGFRKRYNRMKLVTHCLENTKTSKDIILREYLAYKLFNIINEHSFRAQLIDMNYINTENDQDERSGLGILIEDAREVANRIGGKATKKMGLADTVFNKKQEQLTSLFQFMIANTDWSNKNNKNVKLFETKEEEIFSVPYDFDFSGFVSAPYARLVSDFGQTSLKDRVFLGNSKSVEDLQPAIDIFLSKKEEILDEISEFKLLKKSSRKELKRFIKEFYKILENKKKLEAALFPKEKGKK